MYRGFSTTSKNFSLVGRDLINRDLLNHIHTVKGERVMMPDFGTRIPLMVFEPLDQATLDIIEQDLKDVVAYDPRVELIDLAVTALPDNNAIVALIDLRYIELGEVDTLRLEFSAQG